MTPDRRHAEAAAERALDPAGVAALSFAMTIALVVTLYVARFDVGGAGEEMILAILVGGALLVGLLVHLKSTPTRRLPRSTRIRREQRHRAAFTGVLAAALLLEGLAASFDLNSWWEWTVFAGFVETAVGAAVAVQTRLR